MALTYDPEIALALAPLAESGFNPSSRVTATSRPASPTARPTALGIHRIAAALLVAAGLVLPLA